MVTLAQPGDMAPLKLSRFASERDSTARPFAPTWPELVTMLRVPHRGTCTLETCAAGCRHKYIGAWSPASYPSNAPRRKQENVIAVALLVIDVDHASEDVLVDALGKVQRYRYIAHGTHSDRPGDRCVRIGIALSRPVARDEWPRFWPAAMRALDVPADTQCCDANRLYFLPSRPSDRAYMFETGDGAPLDVEAILATAEPSPPPRRPPPTWQTADERIIKRARAYLERMPPSISGQHGHTALFDAVAAMMFGFALDDSTTRHLILDEFNPRCQPPWNERDIEHKLTSVRNTCTRELGYLRDAPDERRRGEWAPSYEPPRPGDLDEDLDEDRDAMPDDMPPPRDHDHVHDEQTGGREDIPPPDDDDAPPPDGKPPRQGARAFARRYLAQHATHPDGFTLRRWRGGWYRWNPAGGAYAEQTEEQIEAELWRNLPIGSASELGNVRRSLIAEPGVLIDEHEIGSWLERPPADAGALDSLVCRNGLVHLPTGKLTPATPRYWTTTVLPLAYDERAPTPARWLAFLRQLWPDDEDSIAFLQEWIGYLLTPDTRQHKIAWLIGRPRSGKGTIGRVIGALLGKDNVAGPTLAQFATNFGLQALIGKLAATVSDARLSGRIDTGPIVERILNISGEDPQTIDRKNRDAWYGILPTRLTIISNEIPRIVDASPALANRSIFLRLGRSFLGCEDIELTDKLTAELPGILLWAIDGWRRLRARGRFVAPPSSRRMAEQMADLASPVGAWIRERCVTNEPDADNWIEPTDALASFKAWCLANDQKHTPNMTSFGRDLDAAVGCERVRRPAKFPGGPRPRVYQGLRLKTRAELEADEAGHDV